jgi:DNA mismatch repair protein MutS
VKEGPANQSFGLQVARLAGVPRPVIQDARRYLGELERRDHAARPPAPQQELDLAPAPDPAEAEVVAAIERLDPDALSPREALAFLFEIRAQLRRGR